MGNFTKNPSRRPRKKVKKSSAEQKQDGKTSPKNPVHSPPLLRLISRAGLRAYQWIKKSQ
jgi:hypothetical protein